MDLFTLRHLKGFRAATFAVAASALLGLSSCSESNDPVAEQNNPNKPGTDHPIDFPPVIYPADNPFSEAKVELGRHLFYDTRMSTDGKTSCGSCHEAKNGFAKLENVATDKRGAQGRQSMPVINVAWQTNFLWDGTFATLEEQVEGPFKSRHEFNLDPHMAMNKLKSEPLYKELFSKAYGDAEITFDRVRKAIATFERTMISGNSRFDQYNRGEKSALNEREQNGMRLFMDTSKTNCVACHEGHDMTDGDFHSTGLEEHYSDGGRETLTGRGEDNGKFRTPTLRNIGLTGPYMHDGRFRTLMDVMHHYNDGGKQSKNKDKHIKPLNLTEKEMQDIVLFMESLTDDKFITNPKFADPWK
jgi:cytochrome c peroxidase